MFVSVCFFSAGLLKLNFNDMLVSSTHTFTVNIFNLGGGETMLAQDKGNFHAPGESRTHDPAVQWLVHPIWYSEGHKLNSRLGYENFRCPERAWFLLLPS